ncbi:hypothetical protein ACOMHN_018153 [Nucella lapillus]
MKNMTMTPTTLPPYPHSLSSLVINGTVTHFCPFRPYVAPPQLILTLKFHPGWCEVVYLMMYGCKGFGRPARGSVRL